MKKECLCKWNINSLKINIVQNIFVLIFLISIFSSFIAINYRF